MATILQSILVLFFCLNFISVVVHSQSYLDYQKCNNDTTFAPNSKYQTNLDTALNSLRNTNSGEGFFNTSVGEGPDTVNAICICRGDIKPDECQQCLSNAISNLKGNCSYQTEAILYSDKCMLRYSNKTIFGDTDKISEVYFVCSRNDTKSDKELFYRDLRGLMKKLTDKAAAGNSLLKFALDSTRGPDQQTIYGLAQCSPDLTKDQCDDCLVYVNGRNRFNCEGREGAQLATPSCTIRYDSYEFANMSFIPQQVAAPSPSPQPQGKNTSKTRWMIIVGIVTFLVIVIPIGVFLVWRRKRLLYENIVGEVMDHKRDESLFYDFHIVKKATNDFSEENKLGQGGFGPVYKGELPNGQTIAVKRLSMNSRQGEPEFKNEVQLLTELQHKNLVKLYGFALGGIERLLVYEFVPNGSLDQHIFDPTKSILLDWDARYKIIGGIARGLLYLHEDSRLRIVHRDLKASNVLLDSKMEPKIADFGTARLFNQEEADGVTKHIVGTRGYMAPEYSKCGKFSIKSDVFSFGVLVLEMIAGQRTQTFRNENSFEGLLSYAWKSFRNGTMSDMIDPTLKKGSTSTPDQIVRSIHIGLLCVQNNVDKRPTIAEVVHILKSYSLDLSIPSEPAFFMPSSADAKTPNDTDNIRNVEGPQLSMNGCTMTEMSPR